MAPLAIEKGSLVLITGVNGYIASQVADQTLAAGFRVRGTVRDLQKAEGLKKIFAERYGPDAFEAVVVKDMSHEEAFHGPMEGCSGVIHTASDLSFSNKADEVIPAVVAGITNVLKAAAHHKNIKRVVYTSSSSAAITPRLNEKFHVDTNSWNSQAVEVSKAEPESEQAKSDSQGYMVYAASKTLAEKECWRFVKEENPQFVLNAVLPNFVCGEILDPTSAGSSGGLIRDVWRGEGRGEMFIKAMGGQYIVNVKDVARIHVAALMWEDVKGERLFAFAEPYNFSSIVRTMKKIDPKRDLPAEIENEGQDLSTVANERAEELLKRFGRPGFTDLETSIKELVAA